MPPEGLERDAVFSAKTQIPSEGGAESGALGAQSGKFDPKLMDADLGKVVAAWPGLSANERAAVLGIVTRAVGDAGDARGK